MDKTACLPRALVWLALVSPLPGCGDGTAAAPPADPDAGLTFTANQTDPVDAGEALPIDGGAWTFDAGLALGPPVCFPWEQLDPTGRRCDPALAVRLAGSAAVVRGDRLCAGTGTQPTLEAEVSWELTGLAPKGLQLILTGEGDAGAPSVPVSQPVPAADGGTRWQWAWDTAAVAEGTYRAQVLAPIADGGVLSNALEVVVDRTPPALSLSLAFDFDAGAAPRDLKTVATVTGVDPGGCGTSALSLAYTGWQLAAGSTSAAAVTGPLALPFLNRQDTTARGEFALDLAQVPYDAWSTAAGGPAIVLTAVGSDALGNQQTLSVQVPVTRERFALAAADIDAGALMALGKRGEIYLGSGSSVSRYAPTGDAAADFTDDLSGDAGELTVTNLAVDVSGTADVVFALAGGWNGELLQIFSDGGTAVASSPDGLPLSGLAVDISGVAETMNYDCALLILWDGGLQAQAGPFDSSCNSGALAVSDLGFFFRSPLSFLMQSWSHTSTGLVAGNPSPMMTDYSVYTAVPDGLYVIGAFNGQQGPISPLYSDAQAITVASNSDLLLISGQDWGSQLVRLDSQWNVVFSVLVPGPVGGPVLLADGDVAVIDYLGSLHRFTAQGVERWASPRGLFQPATPLLDPCVHNLYLQGTSTVQAVVFEGALDLGQGSWPMPGHDAMQSFGGDDTGAIDCRQHR